MEGWGLVEPPGYGRARVSRLRAQYQKSPSRGTWNGPLLISTTGRQKKAHERSLPSLRTLPSAFAEGRPSSSSAHRKSLLTQGRPWDIPTARSVAHALCGRVAGRGGSWEHSARIFPQRSQVGKGRAKKQSSVLEQRAAAKTFGPKKSISPSNHVDAVVRPRSRPKQLGRHFPKNAAKPSRKGLRSPHRKKYTEAKTTKGRKTAVGRGEAIGTPPSSSHPLCVRGRARRPLLPGRGRGGRFLMRLKSHPAPRGNTSANIPPRKSTTTAPDIIANPPRKRWLISVPP